MSATPTPSPCTAPQELTDAVALVMKAGTGDTSIRVYGEPGGSTNKTFTKAKTSDFAAELNPKGDGVLVTLVYESGPDFARSTVTRTGWLVLDGAIYPVDPTAAQAFGLLDNGYPAAVEQAAGISSGTDLDAFGVDDFDAYNADTVGQMRAFVDEANDLCGPRSIWGS